MENRVETAEDLTEQAEARIKENGEKIREEALEAAEEAADELQEPSDRTRGYVRERPLEALGLAAAAGALAALLIAAAFRRGESRAEKNVLRALRAGEQALRQLRDGWLQTAKGFRGAVEAFKGR